MLFQSRLGRFYADYSNYLDGLGGAFEQSITFSNLLAIKLRLMATTLTHEDLHRNKKPKRGFGGSMMMPVDSTCYLGLNAGHYYGFGTFF